MLIALLSVALAAPSDAAPAPAALTTAELGRHDRPDDCWTLIDGVVYDLTPFVAQHPGGELILRACGKDASWYFHNRDEGGGHSEEATALLEGLALGPLGSTPAAPAAAAEPTPSLHPHALRLEGSRTGLLPTAGVGPARSVALRVGHQLSLGEAPSGIGMQIGYSLGWMDVLVSDYRAPGLGAVELKLRPLAQHGERGAPLDLAFSLGGGFASELDAPGVYGQLVLERDLLDRRLDLRAVGTGAMAPGVEDSAALSAGLGLEFRPIPIHSVFAEVLAPVDDLSALQWAAGARLFTRGHAFSLYVSSTPAISALELAGSAADQIAIGGSFERAFRL